MAQIADWYGRKPVFCIGYTLAVVLSIVQALLPSYAAIIGVRVVIGTLTVVGLPLFTHAVFTRCSGAYIHWLGVVERVEHGTYA
jgi:MFS family permease